MKKLILTSVASFVMLFTGLAQENTLSKNFSLGFQLVQYQRDFGIGMNVTSPFFFGNRIAIRAKGDIMWNEHLLDGKSTWSEYTNASVGVVAMAGEIANIIRLYGEGGVLFIFPNTNFSSASSEVGGYGLFGFEFFFYQKGNYYIEIGGVGTGAVADKINTQPIYSNGLIINVGFRFHL